MFIFYSLFTNLFHHDLTFIFKINLFLLLFLVFYIIRLLRRTKILKIHYSKGSDVSINIKMFDDNMVYNLLITNGSIKSNNNNNNRSNRSLDT